MKVILADRVRETKATSLFGCEDVVGCGTGGEVADGTNGFDELGAVRLEGFCGGLLSEGRRGGKVV